MRWEALIKCKKETIELKILILDFCNKSVVLLQLFRVGFIILYLTLN